MHALNNVARTRQGVSDWHPFERELIDMLESYGVGVLDVAGEPHFEAVRHREGDEVVTARLSIERLAKHLAQYIAAERAR
jgi:hypothetical protein